MRRGLAVRTRIVLVLTIVSAIAVLSVGIVVYAEERARVLSQVDDRLRDNLETARFIVDAGDPSASEATTWDDSEQALYAIVQRMSPDDNTGAVGVVAGRAAYAPGTETDIDLTSEPGFLPFVVEGAGRHPRMGTYAKGDVSWRYLVAPIQIEGTVDAAPAEDTPPHVMYVMAYDLNGELAEINTAARVYLIASAGAVVLIASSGGLVASRLLRPVRRMNDMAARISAHALKERLPIQGRDDVSELAVTMNAMLNRLDDALDSQRRLLSDVGHELKTPLTVVRGHLEVMDAADAGDVVETRDLVVDELSRMATLVQDLTAAAALHGPKPLALHPVDAADLVARVVRKASGIEGAAVRMGEVAETVAPLDDARITQALLQLVQNAVTHGGGDVVIDSRIQGDLLELRVRDHGAGVPADMREAIFERFRRGDDAGDRAGSGLGLHIVRVIAHAHGGDARVENMPDGGARFIIAVPTTEKK